MTPVVVGLDVCVAQVCYEYLIAAGVDPVEATAGEDDAVWFNRAIGYGAVLCVSMDNDIALLCRYATLREGRPVDFLRHEVGWCPLDAVEGILAHLVASGHVPERDARYVTARAAGDPKLRGARGWRRRVLSAVRKGPALAR